MTTRRTHAATEAERVTSPLAAIPVASILIIVIAISGAVVVCVHPETLDFATYIKYVGFAVGLLGIGRGLDQIHRP